MAPPVTLSVLLTFSNPRHYCTTSIMWLVLSVTAVAWLACLSSACDDQPTKQPTKQPFSCRIGGCIVPKELVPKSSSTLYFREAHLPSLRSPHTSYSSTRASEALFYPLHFCAYAFLRLCDFALVRFYSLRFCPLHLSISFGPKTYMSMIKILSRIFLRSLRVPLPICRTIWNYGNYLA